MVKSPLNSENIKWGNNCDAWTLLESESLVVIQKRMPPQTTEDTHFHSKAQQVFYIVEGIATVKIEENLITVKAGESIHIPNLTIHSIVNRSNEYMSFLVISEPSAINDRINV